MAAITADRDLLFGLLALQNGLINQGQLVAAFQAWTLDKARALADHLVARGDLDSDQRAGVDAMVGLHLKKHGDSAEKSLAAIPAGRSTRESLAALGDPDIEHTLTQLAPGADGDADRTVSYAVGTATGDGQRFRILRPYAKGGLGQVSIALDQELDRSVALKEIQAGFADDADSRTRFVQEAEITGKLEHPGVIPVYGLGHDANGRPFYAMRFIRGDSLKQAIAAFHRDEAPREDRARRAARVRELLRRFTDICNAVAYAHSRGVLHCDLKPANIMLGPYGETLVVDWGLAKTLGGVRAAEPAQGDGPPPADGPIRLSGLSGSREETAAGRMVGTPAYASPEQVAGRLDLLGPASDVYGLGATLYTLLTGRAPVEAGELGEVLRRVERGEIPPPRSIEPTVPAPLEAICRKAMALRPEDRYASARELAADVTRWLDDEPVGAYREPISERAGRWMRRHRTLATSAAAVLAFGILAIAGFGAALAGKNRELDTKNSELAGKNRELEASTEDLKRARATAEAERDRAKEVTDFLVSSFRKPDPAQDGREVKVVQVLGSAVKALDDRKIGPATKATILGAIGESYYDLGLDPESISINESALAIRRQELGGGHPDTLETMNVLAMAYLRAGQLDRALALHEQVLQARRAKLGEDHPSTLQTMNNLGLAYKDAGQLDRAIPLLEQSLEGKRVNLGEDHPDTLLSMDNLALAYGDAGQRDRALALHEWAFKAYRARLGEDHPDTLLSMGNLAGAFRQAGQPDRAIPLLEHVLNRHRVKLGEDHPHTLVSMNNLAGAYRDAGRLDRAIPLLEQALAAHRSRFGDEYFGTLFVRTGLARCYMKVGRHRDAEPLLRQVVASADRDKPRNDRFYSDALRLLGECLIHMDQFDEAVPILRESLKITEQTSPDDWTPASVRGLLGEAFVGQKEFQTAEPLLLDAQKALSERREKIPPRDRDVTLRDAVDRLVHLYESWGRSAEAERWKRQIPTPSAAPSTEAVAPR
jgi:serine/threonine protein kinase